mgnify:CR=1 FL=1
MKKTLYLFLCFVLVYSAFAAQTHQLTFIAPSDSKLQYTGRINFDNPNAPVMYWPGTYIEAKFTGTSLTIKLDDESGDNFYNVFIDEAWENPVVIDCQPGMTDYTIVEALKDTIHSVCLFRRTEGFSGPTTFLGFVLDVNESLVSPDPKPRRKIEFYGNSITCGMGNEAPDDADDDANRHRNNFMAYGAITARNLNAQYHCIAKSGIGIMISRFDMTMPDYYYRLNPADPTSRWEFSRWTPDVVVINLFQNDSWLIDRLDPIPGPAEIVASYIEFVSTIRSHYPRAHIICTLGSMDATREGSPWPGYIETAVQQFRAEQNDEKVYTHFFEYEGFEKHPRVRHHQKMAKELTTFIRQTIGW